MIKKVILLAIIFFVTVTTTVFLRKKVVTSDLEENIKNSQKYTYNSIIDNFRKVDNDSNDQMAGSGDSINIDNLSDLKEKSNLIAIVKYVSRKQIYEVFETSVEVLKTIKGQSQTQRIVIYEPCKYLPEWYAESGINIIGIQKPIIEDKEYIVFLKNGMPNDGNHYTFTNNCLGIMPIQNQLKIKSVKPKENSEYIVALDKIDFDKYDMFYADFRDVIEDLDGNRNDEEFVELYKSHVQLYIKLYPEIMKEYANINSIVIQE